MTRQGAVLSIPLIFLFLASIHLARAQQITLAQNYSADDIKAAYIYNFTKYITWPNEKKGKPLTISVIGLKSLAESLHNISGRIVRQRPIKIIIVTTPQQAIHSDILILPKYLNKKIKSISQKLKGSNTLIITENLKDLPQVMINFITTNTDNINFLGFTSEVHNLNG